MATVTKSAAQSAALLFGAVGTTANAFTTAVTVVGNAFDVMNVKSNDWLADTRLRSAASAEDRKVAVIDEVTFSIASRIVEREKTLAGNAALKAAYDKALEQVQNAVAAVEAQAA
ncbi:hypothetical protein [Dyella sp. ASV21]|uniref:hypothetical protein n=1 Tax=Dyella sp. ASV21 TaxID=2795114 RepID=UPI0018EA4AF8|nr:hypothetical protein [Dyella sp. ASV21]